MGWFFIAAINPVAHALVNHLDKYLISRYFKGEAVGALILFSALFSVLALPFVWYFSPDILSQINYLGALVLMVNGALLVVAIILYLYALRDNEASVVAPFFQLSPLFAFVIGYLVLGEILTGNQLWAGLLLVVGSLILSLDMADGKKRINHRLLWLMLGSSLLYAGNSVVFKIVAVDQGFASSLFWDLVGKFIFGVVLFFSVKSYREQFLEVIRANKGMPIFLNSLNETLALIGEIAVVYAVLLAPVALVQAVGGLQPLVVLIFGVILTIFFPKFAQESLLFKSLAQKIVAIVIITVGVYFLS